MTSANIVLKWVSEAVAESSAPCPRWLDAATGAGNMTLKLARILAGRGLVVTADKDTDSWTEWAEPKLRHAHLQDAVVFRQQDLTDLSNWREEFDGIVSDTTLSTMGLSALSAVAEWRHILGPGACVILRDYSPQTVPRNADEEIANDAWRLYKAASVLSGDHHYEEFSASFWEHWLNELGFSVHDVVLDDERGNRSEESMTEWLETPFSIEGVRDARIAAALQSCHERLQEAVQERGKMLNWSGTFLIRAKWNH